MNNLALNIKPEDMQDVQLTTQLSEFSRSGQMKGGGAGNIGQEDAIGRETNMTGRISIQLPYYIRGLVLL